MNGTFAQEVERLFGTMGLRDMGRSNVEGVLWMLALDIMLCLCFAQAYTLRVQQMTDSFGSSGPFSSSVCFYVGSDYRSVGSDFA